MPSTNHSKDLRLLDKWLSNHATRMSAMGLEASHLTIERLGQWYVEGDQGAWTLFGWAFLTAGTACLPLGEREHTPQDYPSRRQQVLIIAGCSLALVVGITTVGMPFVPRIM